MSKKIVGQIFAALLLTAQLQAAESAAAAVKAPMPEQGGKDNAAQAQGVQTPPAAQDKGAKMAEQKTDAEIFAGQQSDNTQRYMQLGKLALNNDDAAAAADFFRRAMTETTDSARKSEAASMLYESFLEAGDLKSADELYAQLTDAADMAISPARQIFMQAQRALFTNELSMAAEKFRQLSAQLVPGNQLCQRALEMLARTLMLQGDSAGAQKACADLAAVSEGDQLLKLKALEGLLFCALESGDKKQAQSAWDQLTKEIPQELQQSLQWRLSKSRMLLDSLLKGAAAVEKDFTAYLGKLLPPDPFAARIALKLAAYYRANKNYTKALEYNAAAEKYAEKNFQRSALQDTLASHLAAGNSAAALGCVERYVKMYPAADDRWSMLLLGGDLLIKLKKNSQAIDFCEKVFNDRAATPEIKLQAANKLIWLYQQSSQVNDALKMFDFAIKNTADQSTADKLRQQAGEYLYQQGRYADAAEYFAAAAPRLPRAALWLAQSSYLLKSYSRAMQVLRKADFSQDAELTCKGAYLEALLTEKLADNRDAVKCYLAFAEKYPQAAEAPDALFRAGELAIADQAGNAPEIFMQYAAKFPGERAANALYKALTELLAADKEAEAVKLLAQLESQYVDSKYTISGKFLNSSWLRQKNRCEEALKVMESVEKLYAAKHAELMPEILYERALLYGQLKDHLHMQEVLAGLTSRYADSAIAPQGFFLMGDLKMSLADYAGALAAFKQAQERSKDALFTSSCIARAADAAYALYNRTRQTQHLLLAQKNCETLLATENLPTGLFYQSLYKLACCLRASGDEAGSLRCCREIIYRACLAKREARYYPTQWCAKALDMALKLLYSAIKSAPDEQQSLELRGEALRLLKAAQELSLPGEDIKKQLELVNSTVGGNRQ